MAETKENKPVNGGRRCVAETTHLPDSDHRKIKAISGAAGRSKPLRPIKVIKKHAVATVVTAILAVGVSEWSPLSALKAERQLHKTADG